MKDLGLGDCFDHPDLPGVIDGSVVEDVRVSEADCDAGHDMQIVAQEVLRAGRSDPYPDDLEAQAQALCLSGFESFVGTAFDNVDDRYSAITVFPDENQWGQGVRTMVCAAYAVDGSKLKATLEGAG
jgi:hypothetical protein